mmetsp:Transcript_34443/g.102309  ORF Transcript_34443/g.102309 Transcript_34443/m.102309 type:complete len:222 (+) Transcript_34443:638-1303(+)
MLVAREVPHVAVAVKLQRLPIKHADPHRGVLLAGDRHTLAHVAMERNRRVVQELCFLRDVDDLLRLPLAHAVVLLQLCHHEPAVPAVQAGRLLADDCFAVVGLAQSHEEALAIALKVVDALKALVLVLKLKVDGTVADDLERALLIVHLDLLGLANEASLVAVPGLAHDDEGVSRGGVRQALKLRLPVFHALLGQKLAVGVIEVEVKVHLANSAHVVKHNP